MISPRELMKWFENLVLQTWLQHDLQDSFWDNHYHRMITTGENHCNILQAFRKYQAHYQPRQSLCTYSLVSMAAEETVLEVDKWKSGLLPITTANHICCSVTAFSAWKPWNGIKQTFKCKVSSRITEELCPFWVQWRPEEPHQGGKPPSDLCPSAKGWQSSFKSDNWMHVCLSEHFCAS